MSTNKFFSLIHGGDVTLAPKAKVIPASAFSELLNAKELLEKVQHDAEGYRQSVAKEAELVKEKAQQEGFEEGLKQWAQQLVVLENEISKVHDELIKMVIPVAIKAAKKIVGREIELSETTVVDIVATNLKAVAHHKNIKIYVNREDYQILDQNKERLKKMFEQLQALMIIEKNDVKPGGCIIETEGGIINAQLDNLWQTLENAFQKLVSKEPQPHEAEKVKK